MFLACVSFINMLSSFNATTCLFMMHKLYISQLSLVYVFTLVMDTKKKCHPAKLHAMVYDEYTLLSVS